MRELTRAISELREDIAEHNDAHKAFSEATRRWEAKHKMKTKTKQR